jgi:hypothetical protein
MSNMNLFTWIRDGVRQSVLLGVSDAVEQLGSPAAADELHPSVSGFLNIERNEDSAKPSGRRGNTGRKRLGKSLKEIGSEADS